MAGLGVYLKFCHPYLDSCRLTASYHATPQSGLIASTAFLQEEQEIT
jgi:hypothetical protein